MGDDQNQQPSDAEDELKREIYRRMKFTPESALGRMAGPGAMKGQSPVSPLQQAGYEIESWLNRHLQDADLAAVLHRDVLGSELLLSEIHHPLAVLATYCRKILESEFQLKELVRNVDLEWGRATGERPHFEQEGTSPHPDDPYTIESVRKILSGLVAILPPQHAS